MVNQRFVSSAFLLLLSLRDAVAYPTFIVENCERRLEIGETIMGEPVAPSVQADDDRQHAVDVLTDSGTSACGTTVQQGTRLTIHVDPTLANLVTAEGWTEAGGPNYIVEAANAYLGTDDNNAMAARGCGNSRIVNPGVNTTVFPLIAGDVVVRLLSAYEFGQVYAAQECNVMVTGTRTVVQHAGYLVDNDNLQAFSEQVMTMPYTLTAGQLLEGADSGYTVLEVSTDDDAPTFRPKYSITDTTNVNQVIDFLTMLGDADVLANMTDIQVSVLGFPDAEDDATIAELLEVSPCTSSATCDGFYAIPTDMQCLQPGLCFESSVLNQEEGTITTTILNSDDAWFGLGFSSPGGGMTANGGGSDIFVCSEEGLRRFLVTVRDNPATTGTILESITEDDPNSEIIQNMCVIDADGGRMTFTRTLEGFRSITPGIPQDIIFARGPVGESSLVARHPTDRRGQVVLDLTNLEGGITAVQQEAPWILWCHILFMSLSWGLCLPLAVVIASRTRNVQGAKLGAWFWWHKRLARMGWFFQTVGALFAIYYAEVYANSHMNFEHSKLGAFVVLIGFLQPVSAALRPHNPKGGWPNGRKSTLRLAFEIYHKGCGWTAVFCGMVNVFLGARLVNDLNFEDVVYNFPVAMGSIGLTLSSVFFVLSLIAPNNVISRMLTMDRQIQIPTSDEPNDHLVRTATAHFRRSTINGQ